MTRPSWVTIQSYEASLQLASTAPPAEMPGALPSTPTTVSASSRPPRRRRPAGMILPPNYQELLAASSSSKPARTHRRPAPLSLPSASVSATSKLSLSILKPVKEPPSEPLFLRIFYLPQELQLMILRHLIPLVAGNIPVLKVLASFALITHMLAAPLLFRNVKLNHDGAELIREMKTTSLHNPGTQKDSRTIDRRTRILTHWKHITFHDFSAVRSLNNALNSFLSGHLPKLNANIVSVSFTTSCLRILALLKGSYNSVDNATARAAIDDLSTLLHPDALCFTFFESSPRSNPSADAYFDRTQRIINRFKRRWNPTSVTLHGVFMDSGVTDDVPEWSVYYLDDRESWKIDGVDLTWVMWIPRITTAATSSLKVRFFNVWGRIVCQDPLNVIEDQLVEVEPGKAVKWTSDNPAEDIVFRGGHGGKGCRCCGKR